jgi:3-deoxy-D-manno-octulosonate 8-phosphate phosphatase KdsC-like HAD superfamily phosphatase
MQVWDDLPLTSKVMVLLCAKDGSVVLKAHCFYVSSNPGLRAPLYRYLALSLDSE